MTSEVAPFRFGCQTITFGDRQSEWLDKMLSSVAVAGYDGVEIGFRHIRKIPAADLHDLLERHKLKLIASHVGGDLQDLQAAEGERHLIDEVMDCLTITGTKLLMYSGLQNHNPTQFARDMQLLEEAARACASRGIQLLYHNHDWEFANGAYIMRSILDLDNSAIGLCVDVGWVIKGGQDPLAFLSKAGDRVQAIHFKDFATGPSTPQLIDTVILGQGVIPLAETATWLKSHKQNFWVIAEQDYTDGPPEVAVAANAKYLRNVFGREKNQSC